MTGNRPEAVVIGGGIAGLACAALLQCDGHEVTLIEAQDELGGRAGSWSAQGFRFDTGPSWYLMPEVFDHFYRLMGTSAERQLTLRRLDPGYRVFFEGREDALDVRAEKSANIALFDEIEPGAGAALERYLGSAEEAYRLAMERFLYGTFASRGRVLDGALLRRLPRLAGLLTRSLEGFIAARVRDPRLRQVLGYPAVFLGSAPRMTPSLYHLMSHLDLADGVWYPEGGIAAVIGSIVELARAAGVRFVMRASATRVITRQNVARTVVTGVEYATAQGAVETISADVVVSTADLHHTETRLLPRALQTYPEKWWGRRTSGPGAVLAYLGVEGALPQLPHHSLFFSADWDRNFDSIFREPRSVPRPASAYVCKPSATDATVAPVGHENLFILVPVPADPAIGHGGLDGTGDALVEEVADAAIQQLADWAGVSDLAERIVLRRTVGPADFERDLHAWKGGALGPAHTLRQSAFLRGSNASKKVSGLYYAGSSTVPGIGLPMCLISAELVIKRLRGDTTTTPLPEPL
jgi:phytoene desaturase